MMARWFTFAAAVLAGAALTAAGPLAEGQGKKPKVTLEEKPGVATIRCAGPASSSTDGLCGDGFDTYVDESLGGDMGVRVGLRDSDNNFRLHFYPGGGATRFATVFFPQPELPLADFECDGDCLAASGGGRASGLYDVRQTLDGGAYLSVILWYGSSSNIIANGFGSIPVGGSADGDGHVAFPDPYERGYSWGLWWTDRNYPGATPVTVTRTDQCTWTIEAAGDAVAGLRLYQTGLKGKNRIPYEGRFNMPFRVDFTSPGCGLPDPGQQ